MKLLAVVFLFLSGCATTHVGIIHDYVFRHGQDACADHEGLHYIVSVKTVSSGKDSACTDLYKFRCQDFSLIEFDSGIKFCFIDQMQVEETIGSKQ